MSAIASEMKVNDEGELLEEGVRDRNKVWFVFSTWHSSISARAAGCGATQEHICAEVKKSN